MAFNSVGFLVFLVTVFLAYHASGERIRWVVLLMASLAFYATLKVPYLLGVLAGVTLFTYQAGIRLHRADTPRSRHAWLVAGIAGNLGILVVMKYLPFMALNLQWLAELFTLKAALPIPQALVSIGVSFYVFQALSYLIDIHLEIAEPEHHLGHFALYMTFFPKLLQGPIERPGDLIPQLKSLKRCSIPGFRAGVFLIFLGLFKKCVLADRIAIFVDPVFADVHRNSGLNLLLATYAYAFQPYFDFSGYTDVALGCGKLFNIELTQNFNGPYLARSVADFWRRWHISFSRWILDYLFKPLQMKWRDWKSWGTACALVVAFLASGLWHGATWGFVIWGGLHGLYLGGSILYRPFQKQLHRRLGLEKSGFLHAWQVVVTFHLVALAWVFFRAANLQDAWYIVTHALGGAFNLEAFRQEVQLLSESGSVVQEFAVVLGAGALAFLLSRTDRMKLLEKLTASSIWLRLPVYYLAVMVLLLFGYFSRHEFAYVRF